MKHAVISTTYDSKYLWYLPVVTWVWNKMGYNVICFAPYSDFMYGNSSDQVPAQIMRDSILQYGLNCKIFYINSPKHKRATYAQCSRLYAAALELPEDDVLVVSDIDMLVLNPSYFQESVKGIIDVYGSDLVPPNQYPMCYLVGLVGTWRTLIGEGTVQEHLDKLLGGIECDNMRGNYWGKDQETSWNLLNTNDEIDSRLFNRAKPGTQFADNRVDRDDTNWRSYLNDNLIDAHLWRPGYTDENFANIMELMTTMYPNDDFSWLVEYNENYKQLL